VARTRAPAPRPADDSLESVADATLWLPAGESGLIAKLKQHERIQAPVTELSELRTESDAEQKLVYPFLVHPSFMDLPPEWVRTKEYMEPTEIDKGAGKLQVDGALDCVITVEGKPNKRSVVGRYDPSDLLYYNIDMGLLDALFTFRSDYFGSDNFLPKPFQYDSLKTVALAMRDKIKEQEAIRTEKYMAARQRTKKVPSGSRRPVAGQ
jgi:hypothetical protein